MKHGISMASTLIAGSVEHIINTKKGHFPKGSVSKLKFRYGFDVAVQNVDRRKPASKHGKNQSSRPAPAVDVTGT